MRIICRREKPHPGAQLCLFEEIDGWRYQLLATNTPGKTAQFLEARHRPHARVEDCIRTGKAGAPTCWSASTARAPPTRSSTTSPRLNTAPEHGHRGRRVEDTIGWPVEDPTVAGIEQLRHSDRGGAHRRRG